jgi:hypothetical protein
MATASANPPPALTPRASASAVSHPRQRRLTCVADTRSRAADVSSTRVAARDARKRCGRLDGPGWSPRPPYGGSTERQPREWHSRGHAHQSVPRSLPGFSAAVGDSRSRRRQSRPPPSRGDPPPTPHQRRRHPLWRVGFRLARPFRAAPYLAVWPSSTAVLWCKNAASSGRQRARHLRFERLTVHPLPSVIGWGLVA